MSFKRAGNDRKQLDILRKRRVTELLSEYIPEDEASLISNGRLACLVCSHRPVFDTMNMLTLHRQGKKHTANAEYFYQQKQELRQLVKQRRLDEISKYGTTNIEEPFTTGKFLGSASPYDPRVKKLKATDRKPRLDLTAYDAPNAASMESLPGNRSQTYFTHMISEQSKGPVQHANNLKKIFHDPQQTGAITLKPYRKKIDRGKHASDQCKFSKKVGKGFDLVPGRNFKRESITNSVVSPDLAKSPQVFRSQGSKKSKDRGSKAEQCQSVETGDKKITAEKYLHLRGAGWKKDWDGKWIRDEEAEFDSDEELPDLP